MQSGVKCVLSLALRSLGGGSHMSAVGGCAEEVLSGCEKCLSNGCSHYEDSALQLRVVETLGMLLWQGNVDADSLVPTLRLVTNIGVATTSAEGKEEAVHVLSSTLWETSRRAHSLSCRCGRGRAPSRLVFRLRALGRRRQECKDGFEGFQTRDHFQTCIL